MRRRPGWRFGPLAMLLALAPCAPLAAQAPADTAPQAADTLTPGLGGPSPGGALARSMVLPGWGQFHAGSGGRGFVYMAVHGINTYMVVKTFRRLGDTRERRDGAVDAARDSIQLEALADTALQRVLEENPDTLEILAAADPEASRLTRLSSARRQQREDWMVWAGFWIIASGIDAFVAAHLADFPAEVDVEPVRRSGETRLRLGVHVPLRRRR
ncbi:MAG TPA: DUF5683 domain-containing protein [Longimicrobiales bacterium]|nr:DUF5683 domain-containing protein [Longimicrobiales bacterium]